MNEDPRNSGAGCFATIMIIIALLAGCHAHDRIDELEKRVQALESRK